MKNCTYEKYLAPLVTDELTAQEVKELQQHLLTCERCSTALTEIQAVDRLLKVRKRQPAPSHLYAAYTRELNRRFRREPRWASVLRPFISWLGLLTQSRTPALRLARSFAVLLMGIFIGRLIFLSPQTTMPLTETDTQASSMLSQADLQQLSDYFVQSELLLLTIANTPVESRAAPDDFLLDRDIAKSLLLKSTTMQRKANAIDDESIIIFLNHLEFILLELSNREDDQIQSTFLEIRDMVREAGLVQKSRKLQEKLLHSISPSV